MFSRGSGGKGAHTNYNMAMIVGGAGVAGMGFLAMKAMSLRQ